MGIADDLMQGLGISDPVIRLGVTGLSRAGKTVFITALVANLLDRGRMAGLRAAAGRQPQGRLAATPARRHRAAVRL